MKGFAEAQAYYDRMFPPEERDCPDCDGRDYDPVVGDCPHGFYGYPYEPEDDEYYEDDDVVDRWRVYDD